jgi:imidazolonepropionase-like amidohydrolase
MIKKHIIFILFVFHVQFSVSQNVLYLGGVAHLGNRLKIENSAIAVEDGKFSLVADASVIRINPTAYDTIIKLNGKHIYPAFIVPNTTLGITEIGAVRATHDFREVGALNPNARSLIAYNTDSKVSKTVRTNGVLLAQVTPRGGTISGQSSVMYLDGDNWEDAVKRKDDGIHLNWPNAYYYTGWWADPGESKKNEKYNNKVDEIKAFFRKAKAYYKTATIMDLRMESMKGLFNGDKTLYIHADYAKDMRKAIAMATEFDIKKTVIVGGEEALKIKNLLKEKNIPLILNRVHRLPDRHESPIDEPFTQAAKLQQEGILFCLSYAGDMEAMGARNLPFSAGTTVSYGLEYEDAIAAISLNAAKILGVDKEIGSIEHGKDATFFISSGDALDMRTNNVLQAFINGKEIDLNNHQKELFEKYKK